MGNIFHGIKPVGLKHRMQCEGAEFFKIQLIMKKTGNTRFAECRQRMELKHILSEIKWNIIMNRTSGFLSLSQSRPAFLKHVVNIFTTNYIFINSLHRAASAPWISLR